jgi:hypothetical protein
LTQGGGTVDLSGGGGDGGLHPGRDGHLTIGESWLTILDAVYADSPIAGDIATVPVTIVDYSRHLVGGELISVGIDSRNRVEGFDGSFVSEGYVLSTHKLVLGGIPLTLYENAVGRRAIAVVIDDTAEENPILPYSMFNGHLFSIKQIQYKNTFGVKIGSGTNADGKKLVWQGEAIGLSDTNQVEMIQVTLPSVDEERLYMLNGTPMLARRYGLNWYMVFHTVA